MNNSYDEDDDANSKSGNASKPSTGPISNTRFRERKNSKKAKKRRRQDRLTCRATRYSGSYAIMRIMPEGMLTPPYVRGQHRLWVVGRCMGVRVGGVGGWMVCVWVVWVSRWCACGWV